MTEAMAGVALKPCPFCGGEAALGTITYNKAGASEIGDGVQTVYHKANCVGCGASVGSMIGYATVENAIAAWNTRALPSPATDAGEVRTFRDGVEKERIEPWNITASNAATSIVYVDAADFVFAQQAWQRVLGIVPRVQDGPIYEAYETLQKLFDPPSDIGDLAAAIRGLAR